MGVGSTAKRRRTGTDSSFNSATPSRPKPGTGRGRGRPPNAPRDGRERPPPLAECFKRRCNDVLDRLSKKDHFNIFLEPVNTNDVAGYLDVIKNPMDFTTMRKKLSQQIYKSLGEFRKDLDLIWSNCLLFNGKEPTNVFSKKAIELRRLTEKLIVNTRRDLERDKEILNKWKEKHRKRRETMAANAASFTNKFHGGPLVMPPATIANRDIRSNLDISGRDPMLSTEFTPQDHNGRTPEQNALADSLRLQYAGTTGLFNRATQNAPFPQYNKPDGSIVQIPVIRYNPADYHWSVHDPQSVDLYRYDSAPQLYCDSLPQSRDYNPCHPRPNTDSIYVRDYSQSLYSFARESGSIAVDIVTELLSPELVLKAQHSELSKQGFGMKEIAKRIKASRFKQNGRIPSHRPTRKWDSSAIIQLADEIEKMNKTKSALLPRLSRTINELDGINGLAKFLETDLVREVDEVPLEIVDFAMPHGVNLETISEIHRLAMAPALQLPPSDIRCIESLRKTAHEYLSRLGSEATAKLGGPTVLSSAQLHEAQLRTQTHKRHRRAEAERQAAVIEEHYRKLPGAYDDASLQDRHPASAAMQSQSAPKSGTAAAHLFDQDMKTKMNMSSLANTQVAGAVTSAQVGSGQRVVSHSVSLPVSNQLPPANKESCCNNCGIRDTLGWHAGSVNPSGVERLCIPCGLYWQKAHQHRPKELWSHNSIPAQQPAGSPLSGRTPVRSGPPGHSLTPAGSPNGVSRHSIQKKTPQSSSRRSPSSSGSRRRTPKARTSGNVILEHSNLPPGLQTMPGLPNSIHAAAQRMQVHRNPAVQGFPDQLTVPAPNIITAQSSQNLHQQAQRSNHVTYPGSLPSGQGGATQMHVGNVTSINPVMFADQQVGGLQLQHHAPRVNTGVSVGFLAAQKPSFGQNNGVQNASQAPSLGQNTVHVPLGHHTIAPKNTMLLSENSAIGPANFATQVQLNNIGRSGAQPSVQKAAREVPFAQNARDASARQNPLVSGVGIASVGQNPYAIPPGSLASGNIPGFESGSALTFTHNGTTNAVPGNSEQMMESLLFGEGGITASPTGPPEFDF